MAKPKNPPKRKPDKVYGGSSVRPLSIRAAKLLKTHFKKAP